MVSGPFHEPSVSTQALNSSLWDTLWGGELLHGNGISGWCPTLPNAWCLMLTSTRWYHVCFQMPASIVGISHDVRLHLPVFVDFSVYFGHSQTCLTLLLMWSYPPRRRPLCPPPPLFHPPPRGGRGGGGHRLNPKKRNCGPPVGRLSDTVTLNGGWCTAPRKQHPVQWSAMGLFTSLN